MQSLRLIVVGLVLGNATPGMADERTQRFDRDPGWDGQNNRSKESPRRIVQDFGFSKTSHAGGGAGEIGGFITPSAEPAWYATTIPTKSFDDVLTASGTLACDGAPCHVLLAFFNSKTVNEWRTPNTIALRLSGRGDVFYAWLEYATSKWRAGGDDPRGFPTEPDPKTGRPQLKGFAAKGAVHKWSLKYDPAGNGGRGVVTAAIDDQTAVCNLSDGHKTDGATFDHFGLMTVSKSADTGGAVWLDDVVVNGEAHHFDNDSGWHGFQNRSTFESMNVRPWFNFGFSPTQHAGGKASGELGGLVFRGDCRYPQKLAAYGDRLNELSLDKPLRASGKVCLTRGVTDSTVLFGFYHSADSLQVNPSQESGFPRNFLGVTTDGPSRDGFFFSPAYRVNSSGGHAVGMQSPHIYPDGKSRDWSLEYSPGDGTQAGQITLTLDGQSLRLPVPHEHRAEGARFDRFGIVTTWVDGNGQQIFFDDLTYTWRQE